MHLERAYCVWSISWLYTASMMLEPLEEVGANFSLQLSSRTQLTKINNKKVIAENQCEKHKESSLVSFLANELDARSVLHGPVFLAAVNHICVIHEDMNGSKDIMVH